MAQDYLTDYFLKANERARQHIEPLPLNAAEVTELVDLLQDPPSGSETVLFNLLASRVPPGVDEAAEVKAKFLADVATGAVESPLVSPEQAVELLGQMKGGYNVAPLIALLSDGELAADAVDALEHTLMIYDAFDEVAKLCKEGNEQARELITRWSKATWFTSRDSLPESQSYTVFKVTGEITTDDLSPASDAWSRPDIPLHALAMFKNTRDGLEADEEGVTGPVKLINSLKSRGLPVVFVGDVVGTGSSRKSATNSVLYHFGDDIEGVPNKKAGGLVLGGKFAPIFYNTLEDSGALPIEVDVTRMNMGDTIKVNYAQGQITLNDSDEVVASFSLRPSLVDEVRAGGRIPLIIGRALTRRACEFLGCDMPDVFAPVQSDADAGNTKGFTRAQKMVGRACGLEGVRPGQYVEVKVTTVGSQDTTGPMTRDELKDLACLKFTAPLVMQSFCHTCAYPRPVDVKNHKTLPKFIIDRGGVSLKPGDGVIHSWLNRMCLPDTVGTGGDSHTRMPLGISFPAGSGLVAFAAATGMMPLDMPESVLVRFTGTRRPGITLRDLVHAIPYFARKQGMLTLDKKGKVNVFSGRILEIEGLEDLSVEHAFELADASAERSAAACAIDLKTESVVEYLKSNSALLKEMAEDGYKDKDALLRRAAAMDEFIANPTSIKADPDCEYAAVLEINMDEIVEPILCVPNDPDAAYPLSECQGTKLDEIFVGSCMTNIGHYRAVGSILASMGQESPCRFWMAPPTRMDEYQLRAEGLYSVFARAGARMEMPGCSLCMGNQAHVAENATVISTSTRNFPNRLGKGSQVYLSSAELCAVCARLGYIPTREEYFNYTECLNGNEFQIYRLLNFAQV
ncbi:MULTISPECIES: bifunctional aconitate hydratase 2/2-methylisocitrate dehydratase [unclassified Anaerobiospirillum]|uniref:bifunctional aconitate hydratase 2/2-methylisocitrate dehydratase n=1 Tax=unclassified Anaerobiospirillum TaxID=2647410 RepID=UPI001FF15927|nr:MULTISPECIES: bifunctional aconitate hydratase 2/2-methylisocitrate dehydratase [unclassified Anaerobiospirillum]MCK0535314.1 bifunctional aconitate hydratase 2/2-methylisocitrate dehydratase [Anaerobiospirillum sp. NML120511]MCK0540491.1 bifunctional aconitate hydratase 2/2-methylisocitrate dehydratase [Anaerobiospirillum sp. NML02-A-032]